MLSITHFAIEGMEKGCITDQPRPRFSFALESDIPDTSFVSGSLEINGYSQPIDNPIDFVYGGPALAPFSIYQADVVILDNHATKAEAHLRFETGRLATPWQGQWISDASYHFTEKGTSPKPMIFKKDFAPSRQVVSAKIYATALGVYALSLNGVPLGNRYFAPGYTSYAHNLAYQVYDISAQVKTANTLYASVAGGWAVSEFIYSRQNRYDGERQALLLEIRLVYADGGVETIGSDSSFAVSEEGPLRFADFYDGETYDARIELKKIAWHSSSLESLRIHPSIYAEEGAPVVVQRVLKPQRILQDPQGETIYDFGYNIAGVVSFTAKTHADQEIIFHHAEVLKKDGGLHLSLLRSAKATLTYFAKGGEETYSPRFTYMGFRYVSVEGIGPKDITLEALVLSSDLRAYGSFSCSDARLNQLQQNVLASARANFMDIPTDCPQRDERMGWTGDISMFSPVACANFDMRRFLKKWLRDLRSEQRKTGGLPNVIPSHGYGFPVTMPVMAVDFWGDAALTVPWALYQAYGEKAILEQSYDSMRRYVKACAFWAKIWGVGDYRYLWHTPSFVHFGDWVSPDAEKMSEWQARSKYTATASLYRSSHLLSQIAGVLGNKEDEASFEKLAKHVAKAYRNILSDGQGKMKKQFQTAYVLPIAFDMLPQDEEKKAVANLVKLVQEKNYQIGTGFPGTPFILFALADHGEADTAYRMLFNEQCPSWLYAVKMGATSIWEKFDGLDENGYCRPSKDGTDNMISFNHYAAGSVADFLYRRVAGVEALEPGYHRFQVKPLLNQALQAASFQIETPYGPLASHYEIADGFYCLRVTVPCSCQCHVVMPSGETKDVPSGDYSFREAISL